VLICVLCKFAGLCILIVFWLVVGVLSILFMVVGFILVLLYVVVHVRWLGCICGLLYSLLGCVK